MNSISEHGIGELSKRGCDVSPQHENPVGILVRSAEMHDYEFNPELLAIAEQAQDITTSPLKNVQSLA